MYAGIAGIAVERRVEREREKERRKLLHSRLYVTCVFLYVHENV